MSPEWAQDAPGWAQDSPRRAQDAPRWAKRGPCRPQARRRGGQDAPRWPRGARKGRTAKTFKNLRKTQVFAGSQAFGRAQDETKMGQEGRGSTRDGPEMGQDGAKLGPRRPKLGPRWPKMGARWPKMRTRWAEDEPRWAQDAPRSRNGRFPQVFLVFREIFSNRGGENLTRPGVCGDLVFCLILAENGDFTRGFRRFCEHGVRGLSIELRSRAPRASSTRRGTAKSLISNQRGFETPCGPASRGGFF